MAVLANARTLRHGGTRSQIVVLSCFTIFSVACLGVFVWSKKVISNQATATAEAQRVVRDLGGFIHTGNRRGEHSVYLAGANVDDEQLRRIEPYLLALPEFRSLTLRGTRVSDAGLAYLAQFRSLESISLVKTAVTEEGVRRLHAQLPDCWISYGTADNVKDIGGMSSLLSEERK